MLSSNNYSTLGKNEVDNDYEEDREDEKDQDYKEDNEEHDSESEARMSVDSVELEDGVMEIVDMNYKVHSLTQGAPSTEAVAGRSLRIAAC